jgi:hypothetical protein
VLSINFVLQLDAFVPLDTILAKDDIVVDYCLNQLHVQHVHQVLLVENFEIKKIIFKLNQKK